MKGFLSLLKINLKNGMHMLKIGGKKQRKRNAVFFIVFVALAIAPSLMILGNMGYDMMQNLEAVHMPHLFAAMMVVMGMVLLFFFAFMYAPATFFFSEDLQVYLAMPISSVKVFAAKFFSIIVEQFLSLIIMVPIILGGIIANFSLQVVLGWIVTIFFLPFFPTMVAAILLLLILHLIPAMRSKERLRLVVGLLGILMALGLSVFFSMFNNADSATLLSDLQSGNLLGDAGKFFPPVMGASRLIYGKSALDVLTGLALTVIPNLILAAIFLVVGHSFYLRTAQKMTAAGSREKAMSGDEVEKSVSNSSSHFMTLFRQEVITIMKTTSFFLNGALPSLIMPIFMLVIMGVSGLTQLNKLGANVEISLGTIRDFAAQMFADGNAQLLVGAGLGAFIGYFVAYTGLALTAVTRDAKKLDFIRSTPIDASTYLFSKLACAIAFGLPSIFLIFILLLIFVPIGFVHIVYLVAASLVIYVFSGIELILDALRPYLDWSDETEAMKKNTNVIVAVMINLGIMGLLVAGLIFFPGDRVWYALGVFVLFVVLALCITLLIRKKAHGWLLRMAK